MYKGGLKGSAVPNINVSNHAESPQMKTIPQRVEKAFAKANAANEMVLDDLVPPAGRKAAWSLERIEPICAPLLGPGLRRSTCRRTPSCISY